MIRAVWLFRYGRGGGVGRGPGVLWGLGVGVGLETRSVPARARCYPRNFTFYLGNPVPRLKLARLPLSLAATLAALPSVSEIPFLDSCVPNLISSESNVSRDESGDGIGQVRFLASAERRCASS